MIKYLIVIIVILLILLIGTVKYANTQRKDKLRMTDNMYSLSDSLKISNDKNGIQEKTIGVLSLTKSELQKSNNEMLIKLQNEAKNSSVATRKIESLNNVVSELNIRLKGLKHDTIIIVDSVEVKAKYAEWSSKWYDVKAIDVGDSTTLDIKTYSDIILVEFWSRKGFWLWRWLNHKEYELIAKDLNPYNEIKNLSIVRIKK